MTKIENIKMMFPDNFGIKDKLRNNRFQNSEFLELTLKSYKILEQLKDKKLSITESLKINSNLNIFDHQILAAQRVKNQLGGTAMLADEVGLGKTIEAGIILKEFITLGLAQKILILTPPSLVLQWQDEMLSKFDLDFVNPKDNNRFHDYLSHDQIVMSHSSAVYPKQSAPLNSIYWDLVIVDEAHSMKNANTLKHKFIKNLPKRNLLLLTATPIQNNLEELYNLIELLRPGYLGTWSTFQQKYTADKQSRSINPAFRNELQKILSALIIRTTRKEVRNYINFTDRIPHTNILEPTENETILYNAITKIIQNQYIHDGKTFELMIYQRLASSSTDTTKQALYKLKSNKIITDEPYQKLLTIANNINIDSKLKYLMTIMKGNSSKFLIFTEFYATQNYINEYLKKNGYMVTLFNGKMNVEEKRDSIRKFKDNAQIMISTSAGGEGQNFQFCHNVINYDLPWNPMRIEQRIGRVHRIGQQHDVLIHNFALDGTIESYILELLYTKINLFQMALGDIDLLFEDSRSAGSPHAWFKEYLDATSEEERKNKFSAIGDSWKNRKDTVTRAIHDFNADVFRNFDLSTIGENTNES